MRTRTLTIVLVSAALAACGGKKKDDAPKAGTGSSAGTAAGTAAGTGAGTGSGTAAGTGAGTAAGTGTGSAAPTAADTAMANKAGNCPSSVTGAKSELIEDKTLPNAVVLSITASDAAAVDTIRTRTAHLVGVQAAPDAQVKHSGEGTGGGAGMCPVITSKDVTIASSEIPGGVKVVLTPAGAATTQDLAREVVGRIDQINAFRPAPAADGAPGGGGGAGGGSGEHGGNHSGEGDGQGKQREAKGSGAVQPGAQ